MMNGHMSPKQSAASPTVGFAVATPVMATPVGAQGVVVGQPVHGAGTATAAAAAAAVPGDRVSGHVLQGVPLMGVAGAPEQQQGLSLRYGNRGVPRGVETREGVPLMLPANMIAVPPMRRTKLGVPKPRKEAKFETVFGPGGILTSGAGAVSAGPHHNPKGWRGAAAGAVGSLLIGDPLFLGPLLGWGVCKKLDRKQNTVGIFDPQGGVVQVKLWKAGKHAPLTEAGYWLVASDPRDSEMEIFARRCLQSLNLRLQDSDEVNQSAFLRALVRRHGGGEGVSSLAQLQDDLTTAPWVGPCVSDPQDTATSSTQGPPEENGPQRQATGVPVPQHSWRSSSTSYQQFADSPTAAVSSTPAVAGRASPAAEQQV